MFIVCFDKKLKEKLKSNGFRLLNQDDDKATFIYDKNLKFDFENVSNKKLMLTNKLQF